MAALTNDRDTRSRAGTRRALGAAADVLVHAGAIVVRNAAGFAAPGTTALGLAALGIAQERVDNRNGVAGALPVEIDTGVFQVGNSAGADELTAADIGADCYLVDDQTVAKTNGGNTRSPAGKVFDVDAAGVWVRFA
ncbi:conserved hypothetical protein [uncultured Alphaproteobacteria bacterium]|uniref:Uncharacterized protein n=1 Tax=uncultured Alphaproteobacteria bacterium TaxID=91750 RepID=A0A212KBX5_9PROT|nr:conserved hypothetical protein [uncultured Alphaproteobacteria bacterium]